MASPNAFGSQPTDSLVNQSDSRFRTTSPAARTLRDPVTEKNAALIHEKALERDARDRKIIEGIEWALKVLTIAAACVFGAWAPLSYKATLDGNTGNNAAQKSVVKAAVALSSQARDAAHQQSVAASHQRALASKQSLALDHMNSRIEAIGQLWLYDFCLSRTNNGPCETFTSGFPMTSLVNYLAATTVTTATSLTTEETMKITTTGSGMARSSSAAAVANGSNSDSGGSGSNLAMPAILGIVFGVLTAVGLFLGLWLFRMKRRSHTIVYQ